MQKTPFLERKEVKNSKICNFGKVQIQKNEKKEKNVLYIQLNCTMMSFVNVKIGMKRKKRFIIETKKENYYGICR